MLEFLCLGCEFFKDYKDRDYTAEGLVFNWNQVQVESVQFDCMVAWLCCINVMSPCFH